MDDGEQGGVRGREWDRDELFGSWAVSASVTTCLELYF